MSPESTVPCPKCAVAVPIGYVKCPRCHAAIPSRPVRPLRSGRAARETMREQLLAGGTAVPQPESGGFPWLLAGVCAAAAITATVWYVSRGGAHAAAPGLVPAGSAGTDVAGAINAARPADVDPPAAPIIDPRPRQRTEAITALDRALASDKLWAQLTEVGDAIVIRSGFCADKGVAARVDAVRDQLSALGFHAVRCLEKGGAPVWSRDLP